MQDLDPAVLAAVGRPQPRQRVEALCEPDARAGLRSLCVDLIYGLPRQTAASWQNTLQAIVEMRPDRVAVNMLNRNPRHGHYARLGRQGPLPSAGERISMAQAADTALQAAGYVPVGLDHFALPGDALAEAARAGRLQRDLMGYSSGATAGVVGLGATANTELGPLRVKNDELRDWQAALAAGRAPDHHGLRLSAVEALRADVIHDLMTWGEVDLVGLGTRHTRDPGAVFGLGEAALATFAADGLITLAPDRWQVTPAGRWFRLPMCWAIAGMEVEVLSMAGENGSSSAGQPGL